MASPQTNLRVRISADLADIKQGLGLLRGDLSKLQRDAARATPDTGRWTAGLRDVRTQLAGLVSGYALLRGIRTFTELADQAANLNARLKLVTASNAEYLKAQRATFAIAQRTSNEFGGVAELYVRLAQSSDQLARNQDRLLGITETVSRAMIVSGASVSETNSAIRQFTQAVASGVLRGDEFNSIMENAPRLARALADGLGVPVGALRKMAEEGELTADRVVAAIESQSNVIEEEFGKLPLTVGRATQQVRNALLNLVGGADDASGAFRGLAESIAELAQVLESPEVREGFTQALTGLADIAKLAVQASAAVAGLVGQYRNALADAGAMSGNTIDQLEARRDKLVQFRGTLRGELWNAAGGYIDKEITRVDNLIARMESKSRKIAADSGEGGRATGGGAGTGKAISASYALERDMLQRHLRELDRQYKEFEVGRVEYYDRRRELQQQAIDLEIAQARAEQSVTKDLGKRRDLEEKIAVLERDRADIAEQAARDSAAALEAQGKDVEQFYIKRIEREGRLADAVRARLEAENQDRISRLTADGQLEDVRVIRLQIDAEVASAQLSQFEAEFQRVSQRLSSTEASLAAQVEGGLLGAIEGERQIFAERATSLEQLIELRARTVEWLRTLDPTSPEGIKALEFMRQLDQNIGQVTGSMQTMRQQIQDAAVDSVTNLFMDLVEGSKSAGDALRDFVRGFALAMAQIAARALATYLVLQLLDAIYPGLGKATAAGMSAGVNHSGGIAGAGGRRRWNLDPAMFFAAPRYHGGGIAGLAPDEVPAILQRGEEVLTRSDPRHRGNGGRDGGGQKVAQPIVAIGETAIANAMRTAAGREALVTVVREEWEGLRRGSED